MYGKVTIRDERGLDVPPGDLSTDQLYVLQEWKADTIERVRAQIVRYEEAVVKGNALEDEVWYTKAKAALAHNEEDLQLINMTLFRRTEEGEAEIAAGEDYVEFELDYHNDGLNFTFDAAEGSLAYRVIKKLEKLEKGQTAYLRGDQAYLRRVQATFPTVADRLGWKSSGKGKLRYSTRISLYLGDEYELMIRRMG